MVLLTTTPQILQHISSLPPALRSNLSSSCPDPLPEDQSSPISHKTLVALARLLRENHAQTSGSESGSRSGVGGEGKTEGEAIPPQTTTLNALLRSTKPYKPPPPAKPEPTPEYTALMTRLRAEQEAKQYTSLLNTHSPNDVFSFTNTTTKNPDGTNRNIHSHGNVDNNDDDEEEDPISPSLVLNIFVSVIFCALAVFYLTRWYAADGIRVLMSLAVAIIVGIAETVVYAGYVRNVKRGRARERMKKERKVVLGEFLDGSKEGVEAWGKKLALSSVRLDDDYNNKDEARGEIHTEQEVIWGKGKHGGMRRRVREKWEKENVKETHAKENTS